MLRVALVICKMIDATAECCRVEKCGDAKDKMASEKKRAPQSETEIQARE